MPSYTVKLERIEVRAAEVDVEASNPHEAARKALGMAGGIDFYNHPVTSVVYEEEIEAAELVSFCCQEPTSEEDGKTICSYCGRECETEYEGNDQ